MRGRNRNRANTAEVSLTPMLDVVFILLIFFIVTSTFAREAAIGIEPPLGGSTGEPHSAMLIRIDERSLVSVNGRYTDIGAVRANIERVRAERPDSLVAIEVHPRSKAGVIALVRDAAYAAGYVEGVSLSLARDL